MIKYPLLIAASLLTISVHAKNDSMDGFYIGADVGYSSYSIDGFAETFPHPPNNTLIYKSRKKTNINIDDKGVTIRANFGYGHYWNDKFFTGLELGYEKLMSGDTDLRLSNSRIKHEVDVEYSSRYDLSVLFGYKLASEGLLYARYGFGVTDVNISPHDTGGIGGAFHDLYGPVYGVGYSYMIDKNVGLKLEANRLSLHHTYNNDKKEGENYDISIRDTQLSIGIFYNF